VKSFLVLLSLLILSGESGVAKTHIITNSNFTFSPSAVTIDLGDTVIFQIAFIHNAVEVSQATWNANGNTPLPGGFSVGFGGGTVVLTMVGTHYYVCQPHASLGMKGTITVKSAMGIGDNNASTPTTYSLRQNYPNPFNPSTTIGFSLPMSGNVTLKVYNMLGQEVATLVNGELEAGVYSVVWTPKELASGIYMYRLQVSDFAATKKLMLAK